MLHCAPALLRAPSRYMFAGIAFLALLLGGCEQNGGNSPDSTVFTVDVKMLDKFGQETTTFVQGEDITLVLTVRNISMTTRTLYYSSGAQYDFAVKHTSGAEIWLWSKDKVYTQALTSYTLAPSEGRTVTYEWNQTIDSAGTPIPVGRYVLEGRDLDVDIVATRNLQII